MSKPQLFEFTPFLNREIIELSNTFNKIKKVEDLSKYKFKFLENKNKEIFENIYDSNSKKLGTKNLFKYLKSKLNDNDRNTTMYNLINSMLYSDTFNFDEITDQNLKMDLEKELNQFKNNYFNMPKGPKREEMFKHIKTSFDYLNINDNLNSKKNFKIPTNIQKEAKEFAKNILDEFKSLDVKIKDVSTISKKSPWTRVSMLYSSLHSSINFFNNQDKQQLDILADILMYKSAFPNYNLNNNLELISKLKKIFYSKNAIGIEYTEKQLNDKFNSFVSGLNNIFYYAHTYKDKFLLNKRKDEFNTNINTIIGESVTSLKKSIHEQGITYQNLFSETKNPVKLNTIYISNERKNNYVDKMTEERKLKQCNTIISDLEERKKNGNNPNYIDNWIGEYQERKRKIQYKINNSNEFLKSKDMQKVNTIDYIFKLIEKNFEVIENFKNKTEIFELLESRNLNDFATKKLGKEIIDNNLKKIIEDIKIIVPNFGKKFLKSKNLVVEIQEDFKDILKFKNKVFNKTDENIEKDAISNMNRNENFQSYGFLKKIKEHILEIEILTDVVQNKNFSKEIITILYTLKQEIKEIFDELKNKPTNVNIKEINKEYKFDKLSKLIQNSISNVQEISKNQKEYNIQGSEISFTTSKKIDEFLNLDSIYNEIDLKF